MRAYTVYETRKIDDASLTLSEEPVVCEPHTGRKKKPIVKRRARVQGRNARNTF